MTEIKPCPFCGNKKKRKMKICSFPTSLNEFFMCCLICFSQGPIKLYVPEDAKQAWNDRK